MNYELAKELKDAGFPLEECDLDSCTYVGPSLDGDNGRNYHYPALEELIDACVVFSKDGKGDFHLERNPLDGTWGASIDCFKNDPYISGATPTEATGRLWLELNAKNNGN